MKIKWIKEIAMMCITAIFIVGCTSETDVDSSEQPLISAQVRERLPHEDIHLEVTSVTDSLTLEFGAVAFGIEHPIFEMDPTVFSAGIHRLTDANDTLLAHVGNGSQEDLVFILKLFINYEEVAFYVEGVAEPDTEFVFRLPALHEVDIPFQLDIDIPSNHYSQKLTAVIFQSPHMNTTDDDELMNGTGMALNFELVYGEGGDITLDVPYFEPFLQIEWPLAGLGIGPLTDDIEEIDFTTLDIMDNVLPNPVQVNRGEVVELAFLANPEVRTGQGVPEAEEYVIMMMLDWQQVYPNGQPYLLINANETQGRLVDYDTFTFLAPEETGLFEFVAIMIPNPTHANTANTFFLLEITERFTIEVVE